MTKKLFVVEKPPSLEFKQIKFSGLEFKIINQSGLELKGKFQLEILNGQRRPTGLELILAFWAMK